LGSIANFLLNTPPDFVDLTLQDGRKKTFRVIPEMMKSGFVVSPLLEKNQDFVTLMVENGALDEKRVIALQLSFPYSGKMYWKPDIKIQLDTLTKK